MEDFQSVPLTNKFLRQEEMIILNVVISSV